MFDLDISWVCSSAQKKDRRENEYRPSAENSRQIHVI